MKMIKDLIDKHCRDKEIGLQNGLDVLLDYMIEFFDYSHYLDDTQKHWQDMLGKSRELFIVTLDFMERASKAIEQGNWIDYFGQLYESQYQSKGKASNLGQFFTPKDICDLMVDVARCKQEDDSINDPACGSGRTLLAYFAKAKNKTGYYVGEDIDVTSVKMAALNMMIHGMRGRAIRHDTLCHPNTFELGYEINEVRYPCPTPYYSLRRISNATKDVSK